MFEKIDELIEAKNAYQKKLQESAKETVKATLTEVMKAHPSILEIRWEQYTPYFNDGEPCYFRVYEPRAKLASLPEDGGEQEDGYYTSWDLSYDFKDGRYKDVEKVLKDVGAKLKDAKDALQIALGDHVQVTVTKDGIEVEEYDHD